MDRPRPTLSDFQRFTQELDQLFEECRPERSGEVATYIPELGRVDPEHFAMAVCTVSGERAAFGDSDTPFCIQSCSKPVNYLLALAARGVQDVHRYIGREPSGQGFNELIFDALGRPHNPMVNPGGIVSASMIEPSLTVLERQELVEDMWAKMAGGEGPELDESVYHSELETADRNYALGYLIRERGMLPEESDLLEALDLYFRCCSLELDVRAMSVAAATLANGGVCPTTGERAAAGEHVRACLSLMSSCGMYDFSGEFAFSVGIPAKSGVSGCLMGVVPNVLGFAVWSPRLDGHGNSVRGLDFCRRLVERFKFHTYDSLLNA